MLMAGSMEAGGSEQQTLLLLQHLNRQRFAPELYLTRRCGSLLSRIPADVPVFAFDDHPFQPRLNWPGRWHHRLVRQLRDHILARQIEVVYDRTFHMSLLAGPACGRDVPRVATIVSPPDHDLPASESRFLTAKRRRLAKSYRQAQHVLTVSEAVRQAAIRYYRLPPQQVITVHNPVDRAALLASCQAINPAAIAAPSTTSRDQLRIACIGRMSHEKGQDLLLRAISLLPRDEPTTAPNISVYMIGDGPQRPALEQLAEELGISQQIHFTGQRADVASLLSSCQLLVSPSRYEGLSNVILEAFALEVPVIATSVGGSPELVQHGITGLLIAPDQPAELAAAIEQIRRQPQQAAEYSRRASELVSNKFSLQAYLNKIERLLLAAAGV